MDTKEEYIQYYTQLDISLFVGRRNRKGRKSWNKQAVASSEKTYITSNYPNHLK